MPSTFGAIPRRIKRKFLSYDPDRIENDALNNFSIVYIFVAAGTCLPSPCVATIGKDTH
jgi:hypothetical protein